MVLLKDFVCNPEHRDKIQSWYFNLKGITKREAEIAAYACMGTKNQYIASLLGLREKTIKFHLTKIFKKLKVHSKIEMFLELPRWLFTDGAMNEQFNEDFCKFKEERRKEELKKTVSVAVEETEELPGYKGN